jgi:hypothetical protein
MYKCPKCQSTSLEVVVQVWARLTQDPNGDIGTDTTESFDGSHEWDENSLMQCRDCNYRGQAAKFDQESDPMAMFRCSLCKDLVYADDRRDHLISHSPAYGSQDEPGLTASMFEEVDLEEARQKVAERLYENSDLLGLQVEDANGWESQDGNRVMTQVIFVANEADVTQPTVKKTLTVKFKQASDKIEQADIDGEIVKQRG